MPHKDAGASIADVYAEALYDAAVEAEALPRVEEEILALQRAVRSDPLLLRFLDSPTLAFDEKRRVLREVLRDFHTISLNFVLVLVDRQRVEILQGIGEALRDHSNDRAGIAEFRIASAQALEPEWVGRLRATIEGRLKRPTKIEEKVKPELLGGFVLAHDDYRWNCSLAFHLKCLMDQMAKAKSGQALWTE